MADRHHITVTVNGTPYEATVESRLLLADFLRDHLGYVGVHVGCEHGVCGACTVFLDGQTVRSCLLFAVQADGCQIMTVEGLARDSNLHPLQEAFREKQAIQCGFCTPGMLLRAYELLQQNPHPTRDEIREAIAGNLCRCTGYQFIVEAIQAAAERLAVTSR
ncbi:(2Fe-2S)-binding protein [Thermorudis peleae]|uniref:(2Fe-2S)-binding protein n=1 Tax=Thermorudis peleae TaxID=1382356 RepID=UPI0005705FEF|nr:(2Fe-2S)-binding protein [Thermorudis peleae]MBX6754464.1 (2Fe-2S)-binding protein [Thermorudis peleae]